MNKGLVAGAAVVVAVGAGYAGLIYYQGNTFDREMKDFIEQVQKEVPDVKVEAKEVARTFTTRTVDVKVTPVLSAELPPEATKDEYLHMTGTVTFGPSITGLFTSDTKEGFLKQLTEDGKVPFKDRLDLNFAWNGNFKDAKWALEPIQYEDKENALKVDLSAVTFTVNEKNESKLTMPSFSLVSKNAELQVHDWLVDTHEKGGVISVGKTQLKAYDENFQMSFDGLSAKSVIDKLEKVDNGYFNITGSVDYDMKNLKADPVVSFEHLTGKIQLTNMPAGERGDDLLKRWIQGWANGTFRVELPDVKVTNAGKTSTLKVVLAKEDNPQGPSIAKIDLTYNPASLGNTTSSASVLQLIRSSNRKDWRQEGENYVAHWVLPYEYLELLGGAAALSEQH